MKHLIIALNFCLLIKAYAQKPADGSFMPQAGKYVISAWVKENQLNNNVHRYNGSFIKVTIADVQNQILYQSIIEPRGDIIDGWQRIQGIIEIAVTVFDHYEPNIKVELVCTSTTADCNFDDIRFYPFNGNLKSFVYDEETQRLMAELDENNYATFYEYDLEGGLIRVKKETERGILTIQETRSNSIKRKNEN